MKIFWKYHLREYFFYTFTFFVIFSVIITLIQGVNKLQGFLELNPSLKVIFQIFIFIFLQLLSFVYSLSAFMGVLFAIHRLKYEKEVLAFYSFQTLPVNYAGLLLIALAIIFFIAEIKVTSYGMLSIGGLISLILGSIMLFENMRVSLKLMMPTVALVGGFFVVVATLAFRAYRSKPKSGAEGLMGEIGVVKQRIDPEGLVFVHGEYWRAVASEPIDEGEKVRVEGMDGLVLKVRKV